tara:strand:- start:181 stop:645 length:465 start_codon:yes stop_codon:yes gene_type:complete
MNYITKIILLIFLIFVSSCGYKPILSTKDSNFAITNIKFVGDKSIASRIKNNFEIYKDTRDKSKFYELEIFLNKERKIISKDSKGNAKIYEISITTNVVVLENNEIKNKKTISKSFSYNNSSDKFSLKRYEKNIENNLIEEIVSSIILDLYSMQ